jgi:hypothetical protein
MLLKLIFSEYTVWGVRMRTSLKLFRIWSPEYGNEPLVFRNVENFFTF